MLNRSEALKHIDPHKDWIIASFRAAESELNKLRETDPVILMKLSDGAIAYMMADLIKHQIEVRRIGRSGVMITLKRGRLTLTIDGAVAMRFKKLTKSLKARYSATQAALAFFDGQRQLEELPPDLTNTIAGYVLDSFGAIESIYLTCPLSGKNEWVFELGDAEGGSPVLDLPVVPTPVSGTTIKIKRVDTEEGAKVNDGQR